MARKNKIMKYVTIIIFCISFFAVLFQCVRAKQDEDKNEYQGYVEYHASEVLDNTFSIDISDSIFSGIGTLLEINNSQNVTVKNCVFEGDNDSNVAIVVKNGTLNISDSSMISFEHAIRIEGNGVLNTNGTMTFKNCTASEGSAFYFCFGSTGDISSVWNNDSCIQSCGDNPYFIEDSDTNVKIKSDISVACTIDDVVSNLTLDGYATAPYAKEIALLVDDFTKDYSECPGYYLDNEFVSCAIDEGLRKINIGNLTNVELWTKTASNSNENFIFSYDSVIDGYLVKASGTSISGEIVMPRVVDDGTHGEKEVKGIVKGSSTSDGAFANCKSLTRAIISTSITEIPDYAFYYSNSISKVPLTNKITRIGISAFQYLDKNLTEVYVPDSVIEICEKAFYWCDYLENVTLGSSVEIIGRSAFSYAIIKNLSIPDNVEQIGEYSFSNCKKLETITLGNSVEVIGNNAFYNCSALTSISIPDSVKTIGDSVFSGCSGLQSIEIGSGVLSIGTSPFSGCKGLKSIEVDSNNNKYVSHNGFFYDKQNEELIKSLSSSVENMPSEITKIGYEAFQYCDFASVTLGDNITSIGSYAFDTCLSLEEVRIGSGVTNLGSIIFYGCNNIKILEFNSFLGSDVNVTSSLFGSAISNLIELTINSNIGVDAFKSFKSLETLVIGDDVTSIGNNAFYGCEELNEISFGNSLQSIGDTSFMFCDSVRGIFIPGSVKIIGNKAFYWCDNLEIVNIGYGVEEIGEYAFAKNTLNYRLEIPHSVTYIGMHAFDGCDLDELVIGEVNDTLYENYMARGSVSIGVYAFAGNYLSKIHIHKNIFVLHASVFEDSSPNELVLSGKININPTDGGEPGIHEGLFGSCTELEYLQTNSDIRSSGFTSTWKLRQIHFGNDYKIIGGSAFYSEYLEYVLILGSGSIGSGAFAGVSGAEVTTGFFIGGDIDEICEGAIGVPYQKDGVYDFICLGPESRPTGWEDGFITTYNSYLERFVPVEDSQMLWNCWSFFVDWGHFY